MESAKKLPTNCPACSGQLHVGRLFCESCGTEVCGSFSLPPLARLSEKEQELALHFILVGGSLKDLAGNMCLSYPTVRNLIDDLIEKLISLHKQ